MTKDERIESLRGLLLSHAWQEIVLPMYREKLANEIQALIDTGEEVHRGAIQVIRDAMGLSLAPPSPAVRRGRIKALQDLLSWPESEVTQFEIDKARKNTQTPEQALWEHYATWGRNSPLMPPAYPAESEGQDV